MSSSGLGGDVHSWMLSIKHFLCVVHPPRCSEGGFGEAVIACDMPRPCKFPSLDNCQKRSLWTHKEVDLAPHPVFGLMLQVGDTEKFPHAFGFKYEDYTVKKKKVSCGPSLSADCRSGKMCPW